MNRRILFTFIWLIVGGEELYDRAADIHQWYNLADDPRCAEIKHRLAHWLPESQGITLLPPAAKQAKSQLGGNE